MSDLDPLAAFEDPELSERFAEIDRQAGFQLRSHRVLSEVTYHAGESRPYHYVWAIVAGTVKVASGEFTAVSPVAGSLYLAECLVGVAQRRRQP